MSHHAMDAGHEGSEQWLPLTEYSVKSGVSLSTIRRKIKSNSIPYRLENGRYLVLFDGPNKYQLPKQSPVPPTLSIAKPKKPVERPQPAPTDPTPTLRMLSSAYEHAIKEKDGRIKDLEQHCTALETELGELRFLVKMLEQKYNIRY